MTTPSEADIIDWICETGIERSRIMTTPPYSPHQTAHQIQFLLVTHVRQEDRIAVLESVRARFGGDGELIAETDELADIDAQLRRLGDHWDGIEATNWTAPQRG